MVVQLGIIVVAAVVLVGLSKMRYFRYLLFAFLVVVLGFVLNDLQAARWPAPLEGETVLIVGRHIVAVIGGIVLGMFLFDRR